MLAGLEAISEGRVLIGEREVNRVSPRDRDIAMVFQDYALYPQMTVRDNLAFGLRSGARRPRMTSSSGCGRAADGAGARRAAGPPPARALRRPAAARRAGPRPGARPAGVPDGRAALQPRRQAARADAGRDQAPAEGDRHHHRLRHPRPGRGDDDGRPHRGDEPRPARAGRHARGALRPAGQPVRRGLHRQPGDELRAGASPRAASCAATASASRRAARPRAS